MAYSYEREGFLRWLVFTQSKKSFGGGFTWFGLLAYPMDLDTDYATAIMARLKKLMGWRTPL